MDGGDANDSGSESNSIPPSTKKVAVTLNTKDALKATDLDANVSYYVFDEKDGSFIKSGTTTAGTASFNINYREAEDGLYRVVALSNTAYYITEKTFAADSGSAERTVNLELMGVSNVTIEECQDPLDLNGNITVSLDGTHDFNVLYKATSSEKASYKPVFLVEVNSTSVDDVTITGMETASCPDRKTPSTQRKYYCFQGDTVKANQGIQTAQVVFEMDANTAHANGDYITVDVLDTQGYLEANYANKGYAAVKQDTENKDSNADVGAGDVQIKAQADHAQNSNSIMFAASG
jgi:hypothetical protein